MKRIVVFCGASLGFQPIYKETAIALGNYFAENKLGLVYGGAKVGMMGVLADTVLEQNGEVIRKRRSGSCRSRRNDYL